MWYERCLMQNCGDISFIWPLRAWRVAALALLAVLLAGCGGGVQPFSKGNAPSGKTPPAITVTAMNGMPGDKAKVLFENLAVAAGKRDVAIVQGAFQGGWYMVGEFQVLPTSTATQLTYRWTLYNGKRQVVHTIANTDSGRIGGADPWSGVDPDLLRRVAGFTAESLSTRLHMLGYATRLSGLPPPGRLERAGPNADKDIDYETVFGPGTIAPRQDPTVVAATEPTPDLNAPPARDMAQKQNAQKRAVKKQAAKPATGKPTTSRKKKISAVAMTSVSGSPGRGNQELLLAMRKVMRSAGWPVLTKPRHDALTVTGKVKLDAPAGASQKVAVAWTVRSPDGKVLGTVRQANKVPAGSLNKGWGQAATYVSQAAAGGIFKLAKSAE